MHKEYYKDGTPCECDEMKRVYFVSEALRSETPYVNGKKHGNERCYYRSGALEKETPKNQRVIQMDDNRLAA